MRGGLKTLVIERGPMVKHGEYPTANSILRYTLSREMPYQDNTDNPVVNNVMLITRRRSIFFVKDQFHPYQQDKPFDWIRGYQVGGKLLLGEETQRWSNYEFEAPERDGFAVDWPIRYKDLESWYSYVEKFVGICGDRDGDREFTG